MGYRMLTDEKIYQVFRRWLDEQTITDISRNESVDRKTIRSYLQQFTEAGYSPRGIIPEKNEVLKLIRTIIPRRETRAVHTSTLESYENEIRSFIMDSKEPVKAKTAYEIIKSRDGIEASYSTFKRFVKDKGITVKPRKQMIRIELPPGIEIQVDYGQVGRLTDPLSGRNRIVYAYCGILSHSRLPFIQYVFTQKQESFTNSTIDMLEYYDGTTEYLSIDNLKSGVIKPDLYDPQLNKSYMEMSEYYGIFINTCRVATPTDKGKVERQVPGARELFRKLKALHPTADIHELNRLSIEHCKNEYGMREHGTTKQMPLVVYNEVEKAVLKQLPDERYEVARWKEVKVHPDQFFEYEKKRYSLPCIYRQKHVWVRHAGPKIQVFHEHSLIREYIIKDRVINTTPDDFPEVVREMINGEYPQYLMKQAKEFGDTAARLVESVLKPHAYINCRRAQGMLRVMNEFKNKSFFIDVCARAIERRVKQPDTFKNMLNHEDNQMLIDAPIERSPEGDAMIRNISEYIN